VVVVVVVVVDGVVVVVVDGVVDVDGVRQGRGRVTVVLVLGYRRLMGQVRPGALGGGLPVADPRPALASGRHCAHHPGPGGEPADRDHRDHSDHSDHSDGRRVAGFRCVTCGHPLAAPAGPWCPVCHGPLAEAAFGPGGVVWAATVVHIGVAGRRPPYALAHVDLDEGPRVLVHLRPAVAPAPGERVRVVGEAGGDLLAEPVAG
jgi:uncharacterized OB-fold protein